MEIAAVALGFLDWLWRVMVWGDFAREKQQCDSIFELLFVESRVERCNTLAPLASFILDLASRAL